MAADNNKKGTKIVGRNEMKMVVNKKCYIGFPEVYSQISGQHSTVTDKERRVIDKLYVQKKFTF